MRKFELEPGFTCHTIEEADASYIAHVVKQQDLHCNIINTSMPAIAINNLPQQITHESIERAFQKFHPKRVQTIGTTAVEVSSSGMHRQVSHFQYL